MQERLCCDPKNQPQEALRFAIAFEEGIAQQQNFTGGSTIKKETVYAIDGCGKNPCTICGLAFSQNHLTVCTAKGEKCRNCGVIGHFMRMCKRPKVANFRRNAKFANRGGLRRVNLIGQTADQSEDSSELDEHKIALRLKGGNGAPPFMLKGKINKQPFTIVIDSGTPITIFTKEDVRNIFKSYLVFTRPLSKQRTKRRL